MVKSLLTRISLSATIIFVSVWLLSCAPQTSALPSQPHLNPEAVREAYNDVSLMRYATWALDLALAGKPQDLERLQQNLSFATIRPEVAREAKRLFLSASATSRSIVGPRSDLEAIISLAKQYRLAEARERAEAALQKLPQVLDDLDEMENSVTALGRATGASRAAENSELRIIYKEVTQLLTEIKQPLQPFVQFMTDRDMAALMTRLQVRPEVSNLQPTELSLELAPHRAYVGNPVSFWGRLTSRGVPLPGRDITLELGGGNNITVRTGLDGSYSGEPRLPYQYWGAIAVRARYLPSAKDESIYLATVSPVVVIETPFYSSWLDLYPPAKAYLEFSTIRGKFYNADSPWPGSRRVEIFVDGSPAGSAMAGEEFRIELAGKQEIDLGKHQIKVVAPGYGRYGPASAETSLDIIKATPVVDLETPRLALLPFTFDIKGRVESEVAPLNAARVELRFGQKVAEVATAADGTFHYRLSPGFLFTLIGQQGLEVNVIPREPWNDTLLAKKNIVVFNPVGLAFLMAAVIVVNRGVRLRRKTRSAVPLVVAQPSTPGTGNVSGSSMATMGQAWEQRTMAAGGGDGRVLQLYRNIVSFIVSSLGIIIRPHLTLREIVKEIAPRLSAVSSYLWRMTLIVERALYSRHSLAEKDKEDIEKLSTQVNESVRHGTT